MSLQGYSVRPACFFAGRPGAGPCSGELIRAHLIPKQRIRREVRSLRRDALKRPWPFDAGERAELERIIWDRRCWTPMCGGAMGNAGHHGKFDSGGVGKLVIARADLPPEVEEFAEEHGLSWSLDHDYGPKETG